MATKTYSLPPKLLKELATVSKFLGVSESALVAVILAREIPTVAEYVTTTRKHKKKRPPIRLTPQQSGDIESLVFDLLQNAIDEEKRFE